MDLLGLFCGQRWKAGLAAGDKVDVLSPGDIWREAVVVAAGPPANAADAHPSLA